MGKRRALRALGVLVVAATASALGYRALTRPTAVPVAEVQLGSVREETVGPGTVQSRFSVSVGSRVAGTLERVLVDVGDKVEKGQALATLERSELAARFRASREVAASALQEVALAGAHLEKARSDLALARINNERARALVAAGAIAVADSDQSAAAFTAGKANERAALATVEARKAALARLVQEQQVAETILSYTALTSPMAGVVTRRALEPGSTVAPGAVVFQLVDANALWVATLIDQSLAGRIALGQRAVIRLRSGAEVGGHVARIALEADPVTRELEVDVAFDVRPSRFAIHEEADVTLLGEEAQGLTLPLEAVRHEPDGSAVYVIEDGRARQRRVRLGIVGSRRAQVLEGLRAGDAVILGPRAVRAGQRVVAGAAGG